MNCFIDLLLLIYEIQSHVCFYQLAAFGEMGGQDLPPLELPLPTDKQDRGPVMPVPKGIRPILSKHRIEVGRLIYGYFLNGLRKKLSQNRLLSITIGLSVPKELNLQKKLFI